MITCNECLNALSTSRLADIRSGSPVATHCSTCEGCRRVVRDLQYAENGLATVLDQFGPRSSSLLVATQANEAMLRRRRRVARVVRGVLAFASIGLFAAAWEAFREGDPRVTETVVLSCLTTDRAMVIAEPYIGSGGTIEMNDDPKSITLRGQSAEVIEAAARVALADRSGSCAITPPPENEPELPATPPADKGGTD